jgi:hypothetical protein
MASNEMVINEWLFLKDFGKSGHGLILRYYHRIHLETEENHEILGQDSQSPGRDFNPGPPEYDTGLLTTLAPFGDVKKKQVSAEFALYSYKNTEIAYSYNLIIS